MKLFPPELRKKIARQRRLTRDELALWRHVIADVTPRAGRSALERAPELDDAAPTPALAPQAAMEPPRLVRLPPYIPAAPAPKL